MHTEYRLNHFTDLCQETKKPLTKRLTVSWLWFLMQYSLCMLVGDVSISLSDLIFLFTRDQYTCVDVSNYIVFGASSGSLYIFRRYPCEFLQLIQNVHGSITNVRISPNERF